MKTKNHFMLSFSRAAQRNLYRCCLAYALVGCNNQEHRSVTDTLIAAVRMGNFDAVKKLLEKEGAKAIKPDKHGKTPLVLAAEHGHKDIVRYFLKYKPKPSNEEIKQALAVAKTAEIKQLLKQELDNEASPTVVDLDADLRDAALNNCTDAIKKLLANSAKVDAADKQGKTALMLAAKNGCKESVELLLENGANANAIDKDGETVLIYAAQGKDAEIIAKLLKKDANIEIKDKIGFTALIYAAGHGHKGSVELLLKNGANANANAIDNDRKTALIYAAGNGHTEVVELFLNHTTKPSINEIKQALIVAKTAEIKQLLQRASKGKPNNYYNKEKEKEKEKKNIALIEAAEKGDHTGVTHLLAEGADVNATYTNGFPTLIVAIRNKHAEIAQTLLDNGANVNATDQSGSTALIHAALLGCTDIVKALLEKDAKVNVTGQNGSTALILAAENGHIEVVRLLINHTTKPSRNEIDQALTVAKIEEIKKLLLDYLDTNGLALIEAAKENNKEEVLCLLADGANVNAKDQNGYTALMLAAFLKHTEIVKALLEKGAKVNETDSSNRTALTLAAEKGHIEVVVALLNDAPISTQDIEAIFKKIPNVNKLVLYKAIKEVFEEKKKVLEKKKADFKGDKQTSNKYKEWVRGISALNQKIKEININNL